MSANWHAHDRPLPSVAELRHAAPLYTVRGDRVMGDLQGPGHPPALQGAADADDRPVGCPGWPGPPPEKDNPISAILKHCWRLRWRSVRTGAIGRLLHRGTTAADEGPLDAFEFDRSGVSAAQLRTLAEGAYVAKAEPVLLVGEAGTGKTHLATGLCVAACRQRRRVRFTTATALINELVEAAHANQLSRALGRWERLDLICIDELGYVPSPDPACELMFQVIAARAEKAAVIVTTNLPFSEWSQVIPNRRLCKALIDRLTDRAHIITTGADSYRFRRTTAQRKASKT